MLAVAEANALKVLLADEMITRFDTAARQVLSVKQHLSLSTLTETLCVKRGNGTTHLQDLVDNRIVRFQAVEPIIANRIEDHLTIPSGSPSALLGIIMHYPTLLKREPGIE
jgi:hypothetical protein